MLMLPERAMMSAANYFVNIYELMEGVGRRLAELTGAEWGIVTSGAAASLYWASAAGVACNDVEKIVVSARLGLISELPGFNKNCGFVKYRKNVPACHLFGSSFIRFYALNSLGNNHFVHTDFLGSAQRILHRQAQDVL